MNFPEKLKYTEDHEWLRVEGDVVVVGITEHASEQLGDVAGRLEGQLTLSVKHRRVDQEVVIVDAIQAVKISGAFAADYDGDTWPDLLVTNFGRNILYRNRGDGTFENVAGRLGIEAPGWNTGAAFFDAEGDGDLAVPRGGWTT